MPADAFHPLQEGSDRDVRVRDPAIHKEQFARYPFQSNPLSECTQRLVDTFPVFLPLLAARLREVLEPWAVCRLAASVRAVKVPDGKTHGADASCARDL